MASITKRPDGRWRARYRDAEGKEHAKHFSRKVDGTALRLGHGGLVPGVAELRHEGRQVGLRQPPFDTRVP